MCVGSVSECDRPFLLKTNFVAEAFGRYKLPEEKAGIDIFCKMVPASLQEIAASDELCVW